MGRQEFTLLILSGRRRKPQLDSVLQSKTTVLFPEAGMATPKACDSAPKNSLF